MYYYYPNYFGGCPNCGRCPSCGRNGYQANPYWVNVPYCQATTGGLGNAGNLGMQSASNMQQSMATAYSNMQQARNDEGGAWGYG